MAEVVARGWVPHSLAPLTIPLYRFATKERDGLLLYNGRFNEKHDFVALEVIQEQVQLTFSAGESSAACPCPSPKILCPPTSDLKPCASLPVRPGPGLHL